MTKEERKRIVGLTMSFDLLLDYVQELLNQQYDEGWDAAEARHGVDTG